MTHKLYIIMRTDMASLNPGKACAQAAHAANQFNHRMLGISKMKESQRLWKDEIEAYQEWGARDGFGTTIVVGGIDSTMCDTVQEAMQLKILADYIVDNTYPLLDGDTMHYFPCRTCAYVFVPSFTMVPINLKKHKLLP